jgi:trigger factor
MNVVMQSKGELAREMKITVPAFDVDRLVNDRLARLSLNLSLPGFRPGKVPADIVRQRYGDQVKSDVRQDLVSETLPKAFSKENVRPAGQPAVDFGDLEIGRDFTYTVSFDVLPTIDPKNFEKLKLARYTAKPSDKMVKDVLKRLEDSRKTFKEKTGKAAKGDAVVITAQGFDTAGKAIENALVKDFELELGSNQFIPGFEDGLIGKSAGQDVTLNLTFPADYHNKDLAAKPVRFEVKVHTVKGPDAAPLDDEAAKMFGAANLKELEERVREQVGNDLVSASEQRLKRELFDHLDSHNTFTLPESLVESEFRAIWRNLLQDMRARGYTFQLLGKSEDEVRAEHRALAERRVRLGLLLAEIGQRQGVKVATADAEAEVERIAKNYGPDADKVRQYYKNEQARAEILGPLFEKKVCEWIFSSATITEKAIDAEELMKEITG